MEILGIDRSSGYGKMLRVKLEEGDTIPAAGAVLDVFGTKYKVAGAETSRLGDELSPHVGLLIERVTNQVLFTKNSVKAYLDKAIRNWRKHNEEEKDIEAKLTRTHYIDAFQRIRISLFGETLS